MVSFQINSLQKRTKEDTIRTTFNINNLVNNDNYSAGLSHLNYHLCGGQLEYSVGWTGNEIISTNGSRVVSLMFSRSIMYSLA